MIMSKEDVRDMKDTKDKNKDLEIAAEKLRLEYTKDIINNEVIEYLEKRKEISQYILDYRKNVIEEFRDDEDKIIDYFDHERYIKEEAFKTIDRRLKELTQLKLSPYFGKVTFIEEGDDTNEQIYIGKFGVIPDSSIEPVVVDWRAPVSSLFYAGTLGKATYNSPEGLVNTDIVERRQFIIKKAELQGMFDSELDIKDEILQIVLSSNSSEKLKDIITTIQKEQDIIIRYPKGGVVAVNGVAGSGKTTIALHRVAYLIYNNRKALENKVLILGPNNIFMEYISSVLPSLGEVAVKQETFQDFAKDILEIKSEVMNFKDYVESIVREDKQLTKDIEYKNSREYIKFLDQHIGILNKDYFHIEDLYFRDEIIVEKSEIEEMFNIHYAYMPLFKRSKRIRRVLISKIKDKRDDYFRKIEKKYKELIDNLSEEEKNDEMNTIEYNRKLQIRELIRDVMSCKEQLHWLDNESLEEIYLKLNENNKLIIDDLAPMLYLKLKLYGVKYEGDIKHVVIDEAQDYSLIQMQVIKEITKCNSFTIVGDINQRLINNKNKPALDDLNEVFTEELKYFNLNKSYRSTKQIIDYANGYLTEDKIVPFVRDGEEVEYKIFKEKSQLIKSLKDALENFKNKGYDTIAVICRDEGMVNSIKKPLKDEVLIKVIASEDDIYSGGAVLIPSYFAKGLEFDAAILVDNKQEKREDLVKYVMCTRALHELKEFNLI